MSQLIEVSDSKLLPPRPTVSVIMITYNHEAYIADAIEGVVAQIGNFDIELLIGNDASTDNTLKIALEYQQRYPQIIRVIFSDHNVGMVQNSRRLWGKSRGQYIAYCEGDDYWSCNDKLARQVSILSSRPECGIAHSDWVTSQYDGEKWVVKWGASAHKWVNRSYLEGNVFSFFYFPKNLRTCTILIKKELVDEVENSFFRTKPYKFGDCVFAAFITSKTKVAYLPDVTAVYRISPNSALRSGRRSRIKFLLSSLDFDSDARIYFSDRNDYPIGYRWEICIGLILWSITALDFKTMCHAFSQLKCSFTIHSFLYAARHSISLRIPRWNNIKSHQPQKVRHE